MKSTLKNLLAVGALVGLCASANGATVTVDPGASWNGYMNVFDLNPTPGAGPGGYVFGSGWGTADLVSTWSGPVVTLSPNTIGDPNPFWYTPSGGPGAIGNKIMDANLYVETTDVYNGQTLTFQGKVLANTLVGQVNPRGDGWSAVAFIKDFAPDYSSFTVTTAPLSAGNFSISLAADPGMGRHLQWGFTVTGPDVWITDVGQYGNIQITAVPEPSTLALLGLGVLPFLLRRRQ